MEYSNPIGVVAMPQSNNFDRTKFIEFVRESNMNCCVVLDDFDLAAGLNIEYPIYRNYNFEPNPGNDVESANKAAERAIDSILNRRNYDKVYWQINNEPDVTALRFIMYARMIGIIKQRNLPIKCVFGNFSSGSVKCGQGTDTNDWFNLASGFLIALEGTPHLIGVHEYTSYTPWYVSDGGKYKSVTTWKNRPSKIDWSLPQWHIGRNWQGIKATCDKLKIDYPKIIVTEALIDRMNDIMINGDGYNGYKTYTERWHMQFPEFKLGELYAHFLMWAWETIYAPVKQIVGMTTFCFGNTGKWENYNVAPDKEYQNAIGDYLYVPKEEPLPETLPDISNPKKARILIPSDFVNVRDNPGITGKVIFTLANKQEVVYYPNSERNGWIGIRVFNVNAWVSLQGTAVKFEDIIETPPTPPEITPEELKRLYDGLLVIQEAYKINTELFKKNLDILRKL